MRYYRLRLNDHYERDSCDVEASRRLAVIPSHSCEIADLATVPPASGDWGTGLDLGTAWTKRWTVSLRTGGAEVACPARDLGSFPLGGCEPVRRFSWRRGQRHRPGLHFMVSTGRHHGFESLEEARLLLALDFAGRVSEVVSQPFRLRFTTSGGAAEHVPDVLAVTDDGTWLFDVRPADRIGDDDRAKFAASAELALACGWRYLLVTGWRKHAMATLDALSSQRRPMGDPLGLRELVLGRAAHGGMSFGEIAAGTLADPVARAQALHLLWSRRLSVDLARPLTDATVVSLAGKARP
jgi:hypothetical protein